jgi:hypothetical protein
MRGTQQTQPKKRPFLNAQREQHNSAHMKDTAASKSGNGLWQALSQSALFWYARSQIHLYTKSNLGICNSQTRD